MGRRLAVLVTLLVVALALVVPGAALAAGSSAESTSGYNQTPTTPTGTSPSKETTTPAAKEEPAKASSTPTSTEKAKTLPFTGFDLRWTIAVGLLMLAAGFSIVLVTRRPGGRRSR